MRAERFVIVLGLAWNVLLSLVGADVLLAVAEIGGLGMIDVLDYRVRLERA